MAKKFLRRGIHKYLKLGRKKKLKWRKPKGRDNKMREKKKGHPKIVSVGYKKPIKQEIVVINNIKELKKDLKEILISSKVGMRKRQEIVKKAEELGIKIKNLKKAKKNEPKE